MKKKQVVTAKAKENLAQFKGGKLINFKRNLISPEICGHTFMVCLNKNNSIYNIVEITKEGTIIGRYKDLFKNYRLRTETRTWKFSIGLVE